MSLLPWPAVAAVRRRAPGDPLKVPRWIVTSVMALSLGTAAVAKEPAPSVSAVSQEIALTALPGEAQQTHRLILAGGPFPFSKDGVTFGNRERLLPGRPRGFYREYTVKTPQARNRGARRLVCGGTPPTQPEACYYTDDHYASFKRVAP